jgi:hypothetical protein
MNVFVEMALGWLIVGSLVAGAVLAEHFHSENRFPGKAGRWLIPALIVWWPWPIRVWYASHTKNPRAARVGLVTFVLIGALGFGWVSGSNLYEFLYPKELESPDTPALNAMIEGIVNADSNGNPSTSNGQSHVGIPPPLFTFR